MIRRRNNPFSELKDCFWERDYLFVANISLRLTCEIAEYIYPILFEWALLSLSIAVSTAKEATYLVSSDIL